KPKFRPKAQAKRKPSEKPPVPEVDYRAGAAGYRAGGSGGWGGGVGTSGDGWEGKGAPCGQGGRQGRGGSSWHDRGRGRGRRGDQGRGDRGRGRGRGFVPMGQDFFMGGGGTPGSGVSSAAAETFRWHPSMAKPSASRDGGGGGGSGKEGKGQGKVKSEVEDGDGDCNRNPNPCLTLALGKINNYPGLRLGSRSGSGSGVLGSYPGLRFGLGPGLGGSMFCCVYFFLAIDSYRSFLSTSFLSCPDPDAILEEMDSSLYFVQFPTRLPRPLEEDRRDPLVKMAASSKGEWGGPSRLPLTGLGKTHAVKDEEGSSGKPPPRAPAAKKATGDATGVGAGEPLTFDQGLRKMKPGKIGKLYVHRSGNARLVIGGVSFMVHRGLPLSFVEEGVSISQEARTYCAIGQV
ncbi:unnamed protein product, partial [Discosporangium mesarthrocarpum]